MALPLALLAALLPALAHAQDFAHQWQADFAAPGVTAPLRVERDDPATRRFSAADHTLTITTRAGDIYQHANDCANLFCAPAPEGDFCVTLHVRRFEPSQPIQHLSLGVFQSDDKLVRLTYWWRGADRGINLDREDRALQHLVAGTIVEYADQPFKLRLALTGRHLVGSYAAEGAETWTELGAVDWDGTPRLLGFYASNGLGTGAGPTEAVISGFEVASAQPIPAEVAPMPPAPKPTLNAFESYGWLRGLNSIPSWGARIEEAWWFYDPATFRQEMSLIRGIHGNCVRLWIEFTAWMADPEAVTAHFMDAVAACDENGLKVMPCLFNRWHDWSWDYGGTYTEDLYRDYESKLQYVRALVTPLAADPRILCWDLCNEPQAFDQTSEVNQREFAFLRAVADTVREAGAQQPITMGTMAGSNIEIYAPLCDVLCGHPYAHNREDLAAAIAALQELGRKYNKPVLVNECIPGCLDDAIRAEAARYGTQMLADAGLGWMGWSVKVGKAISTRRDRYDGNGVDGTGFHAWYNADNTLRPGLEFLLDKPALQAPWETGN
jgi:hypothetical protein